MHHREIVNGLTLNTLKPVVSIALTLSRGQFPYTGIPSMHGLLWRNAAAFAMLMALGSWDAEYDTDYFDIGWRVYVIATIAEIVLIATRPKHPASD